MSRRWDNQFALSPGEVMAYAAGVFLIALGRALSKAGR